MLKRAVIKSDQWRLIPVTSWAGKCYWSKTRRGSIQGRGRKRMTVIIRNDKSDLN